MNRSLVPVPLALICLSQSTNALAQGSTALESAKMAADASRFGAWLVFAAAMVSGVIALVGWWIKSSMNRRTIELKQHDQKRLRLDTFISAVGLLSTAQGKEVSDSQKAAVLFVLMELEQLDFAVSLLNSMWSNGKLGSETAVWVADRVLTKGSFADKDSIAQMLCEHAEELVIGGNGRFAWPNALDDGKWNPSLSVEAREALMLAVMKTARTLRPEDWDHTWLASVAVLLDTIATKDPDMGIKAGASEACMFLLDIIAREEDVEIGTPTTRKWASTLRSENEKRVKEIGTETCTEETKAEVTELEDWRASYVSEKESGEEKKGRQKEGGKEEGATSE